MRQAAVYWNGELAGYLRERPAGAYEFEYTETWFLDTARPAICLSLPKSQRVFRSAYLFPFFSNLLSEGANRRLQSRFLQIDEQDTFGLLIATAQTDTIGAVTVKPIPENEPA